MLQKSAHDSAPLWPADYSSFPRYVMTRLLGSWRETSVMADCLFITSGLPTRHPVPPHWGLRTEARPAGVSLGCQQIGDSHLNLSTFQRGSLCVQISTVWQWYWWAIINLSVQASHRHRNSWKSHFLPQKVYKSAIWNESSVEWTLVDLDFAFVNDFQFWGCPTATKMTYFELHNKRLLLVYSWQFQDSLWKTLFLSEQIICINFLLIWFRSACSINLISVAVGQPLKPLI